MEEKREKRKEKNYQGFTLIEIMVAVTIFSIVMLVASSAVISMNHADQKAQATRVVMDNVNAALESMARRMRIGTSYHCGEAPPITTLTDCALGATSGAEGVAFLTPINGQMVQMVYRLNQDTHAIEVAQSNTPGEIGTFLPVTSPEIEIQHLSFFVEGARKLAQGDAKQPVVLVLIDGRAGSGLEQTIFSLQTTVVQRKIDL